MARAVSSLIVGLLLCVACPAVEAKDVGQLNLNKFLKGFWGCEISTGQGQSTRGHIDFESDAADADALIADYYEFPSASQRRQIREYVDEAAEAVEAKRTSPEGAVLTGKLKVELRTPTSGAVSFSHIDSPEEVAELFQFKFNPNSNSLHEAFGQVAEGLGRDSFHATIVSANQFQVTVFGSEDSPAKVESFSAKKGVAPSKQSTWASKWGPSLLVFVFFIGSKFLRKKFGKQNDFTQQRQKMPPTERKMPPVKGAPAKSDASKKVE